MSLATATTLFEEADRDERAGRLDDALSRYERGIAILLDLIKVTPNPVTLRKHAEHFLSRAEAVKGRKKQRPRQVPVSRGESFPAPTRSKSKPSMPAKSPASSIAKRPAARPRGNGTPARSTQSSSGDDLRALIESEIIDTAPSVSVHDIIGLEQIKRALYEAIILPRLTPAMFTGLRAPPKAILLFGPPGNGKTLIAKAVAAEGKATFFSVSASTLTSKYVGQGEKLVRTLFEVAHEKQPSIVFIDEVDSILSSRGGSSEHEASRRLKTEFLVRFDGVSSNPNDQLLIIAATNLPGELDEAVLRRFARKFYIPQPEPAARRNLITSLLTRHNHRHTMTEAELTELVRLTEGFSGSDLTELCKEAAMWPIREMGDQITRSRASVPAITFQHFQRSLQAIKPSTSKESLEEFERWNQAHGSSIVGLDGVGASSQCVIS
ncbi:microtubule-severing ATPase [Plasmodiophora brassicae]|uniref:microtubule-severing ATPase n=1 Tax=Plasmodiophora brassicae TaxID=37360 RepID=A0A3P3YIX3_PLABS|nr:unnamed protein product [Plasmodiophora brassicae]